MIGPAFRRLKRARRVRAALADIAARPIAMGQPHGLPTPLVVSLTSYPRRFGTLHHTLRALLTQTVRPDRVVLWLAHGDDAALPPAVTALRDHGLEIACCDDLRSYNKIIPSLRAWPEAHIVTADDDVYYRADWLERLVAAAQAGAPVACHRAHRITLDALDQPQCYKDWAGNIAAPETGPLVFLTGVMGVIYAPGALHSDVLRQDLLTRLCPAGDDIWLYWMSRLAGHEVSKIGGRARIVEWPESQQSSLRSGNLAGRMTGAVSGNDRALNAMLAHYGFPGA